MLVLHWVTSQHVHLGGERGTVIVKILTLERNKMSQVGARTQTARSGGECPHTNIERNWKPYQLLVAKVCCSSPYIPREISKNDDKFWWCFWFSYFLSVLWENRAVVVFRVSDIIKRALRQCLKIT